VRLHSGFDGIAARIVKKNFLTADLNKDRVKVARKSGRKARRKNRFFSGSAVRYSRCRLIVITASSTLHSHTSRTRALSRCRGRLNEVPGPGRISVETIIAEIGADMSLFPTPGHLVSWAGLAPRLMRAPVSAAQSELRTTGLGLNLRSCKLVGRQRSKRTPTYRRSFCALKARRGPKKALIAVAASITIVYRILRDGTRYSDLGPEYFAGRNPGKLAAKLANRTRNLGYHVEISTAAA
jgi:hypothetical protein